MTVISNPLLLKKKAAAGGGGGSGEYQIQKSLRFSEPDDPNLKKTFAIKGNQLTWTYSAWVKNCKENDGWWLIGSGNTYFQVVVSGDDSWIRANFRTASTNIWWDSGRQINDPSAWYHVVIAVDYTQSENADKVKLYINGKLDPTAAGSLGKNYASTNQELLINQAGDHYVGSNNGPSGGGAYLADVHFIDGLQLHPAAFAEKDSNTNVWNPKAFALSNPNVGNSATATQSGSGGDIAKAFDGVINVNNRWMPNASADQWIQANWATAIKVKSSLRIYAYAPRASNILSYYTVNGGTETEFGVGSASAAWFEIPDFTGDLSSLRIRTTRGGGSTTSPELWGVEVDGVVLRNGHTDQTTRVNPNNNIDWATKVTFNSGTWNANSGALSFDGKSTTSNNATADRSSGGWATLSLADFAGDNKTIEVTAEQTELTLTHAGGTSSFTPGDTSNVTHTFPSVTLNSSSTLKLEGLNSGSVWVLCRVKVDGVALVNSTVDNSFHLKFDDVSTQAALGTDSFSNGNWTVNNLTHTDGVTTVANADAKTKPIYVTTGDQGGTKGSGYNADAYKSLLVFAVPGDTIADVSHVSDLRNSGSAVSITNRNSVDLLTTQSRFYGTSMYFDGNDSTNDGTGDAIHVDTSNVTLGTGEFTVEFWVRFDSLFNNFVFFDCRHGTDNWPNNDDGWSLNGNGAGNLWSDGWNSGGGAGGSLGSAAGVLKATTWQHIAVTRDSSNVMRIFVDGTQVSSRSSVTQDFNETKMAWGNSANFGEGSKCFMQDIRVYKGSGACKYTSAFDVASAGNPEALDSLTDSPTAYGTESNPTLGGELRGNYCTWNPLDVTLNSGSVKFDQGNLFYGGNNNAWTKARSTMAFTTGKWYFEVTLDSDGYGNATGNTNNAIGIGKVSYKGISNPNSDGGAEAYFADNGWYHAGFPGTWTNSGSKLSKGDVIGVAFDCGARSITWYKNGTQVATASGLWAAGTLVAPVLTSYYRDTGGMYANFGQRPFKYTAPSDYKCLCTSNYDDTFSGEAAGTVNNPSKFFDTKTFTGTAEAHTVPFGFTPDLVWHKERNNDQWHMLVDSVRGSGAEGLNKVYPNQDDTENSSFYDASNKITFDSSSVKLWSNGHTNTLNDKFVLWGWDAGTAALGSPLSGGDITPSAQWVNATAGFSMCTWTGTAATETIAHGLSAKPDWYIVKKRDEGGGFINYHKNLTAGKGINWTGSATPVDTPTYFGDTEPTSDYFTVSTNGETNGSSGKLYVAYVFTSIPGYSSFENYVGTSGEPFVYLGFTPKYFMLRRTDGAAGWYIFDSERDSVNPNNVSLKANTNDDEGTYSVDFLSNGVRINSSSDGDINGSGANYIYAAFAEHPFKIARAR